MFRPVCLVLSAGADRSRTLDLIEEDDGGTHLVCLRTTQTDSHAILTLFYKF